MTIFSNSIDETQPSAESMAISVDDGGITAAGSGLRIHCLSIIGQIEGHYLLSSGQKATRYEHLLPQLVEVEMNDQLDGLIILLNTVGGDVEAGLCLAEMIAGMNKPTVTLVLGGGHSIGVPLAVSGKRSFIAPSATMTLHPVRINGMVIGAPQTYRYFEEIQERIIAFISRNSRADSEQIRRAMMAAGSLAADIGTIIDGPRAVELGLIDAVGGISDAIAAIREAKKEHTH
jgi:ATP-dependent protease ClpP protease subunit